MNKIFLIIFTLGASLLASEIPLKFVKIHNFNKSVALNAQIIQLANAEQSITSLVSGHLEKYYVKPAQKVKEGQRVALIESIVVSKMSANYLALTKQLNAVSKNYDASKKLYIKGMTSMQNLNNEEIKKSEINSQLTALKSQLETLGINASKLKNTTSNFVLYAHSSGTVSALLKPLHSSVNTNEPLVNIVKNQAYYVKSFLPLEYATKAKIGDKIVVDYDHKKIVTHITQILPKLDIQTQRVVVLSSVDENIGHLFINTYLQATLYFSDAISYKAVEKSALSFFSNEWVVFIPKKEQGVSKGEVAYTFKVVEILTQNNTFVAIDGLELGEEYVSDKAYYVKSMLLKGSLGDGD